MKKTIRVADFIVNYLERLGMDTIFTVSGGGSIFLCDALSQAKKMKYICCHHEQAAAMATEAYARAKLAIGVTLVTTGPGGTNAITGIAGSWMDSVPHLVISGQVFLNQTIGQSGLRQLGVQEINIVDLVRPVTKYAVMLEDPSRILFELQKSIYLATSGRPGPVWLDIPANVQNAQIDPDSLVGFTPPEDPSKLLTAEAKIAIANLAKKLVQSSKPLLHIGQGVRIAGAEESFLKFIEKHQIPFVTARNANDLYPSSHPLYVGRPGTFAQRGANFAVQNSDLYLAVGTRLSLPQTGYNSSEYAKNAYTAMVDIDRPEMDKKTLRLDLKIECDAKVFLKELEIQMNDAVLNTQAWSKQCRSWLEQYPVVLPEYRKQETPVNSYYFIEVLSKHMRDGDVVVTDMGLAFQGTHQAFDVKKGVRLFTNSGFASMGWGLPAAIGACFARNRQRVVCLAGEGGLLMNIQELATVMYHKLPIKLMIYNNGGYMTIKQTQEIGFNGRLMGCNEESGLSFPNFEKIAEAHNLPYFKLEKTSKVEEITAKVLDSSGPAICEIMLDHNQQQIPRATSRKRADGSTEYTAFEDLFPFLDRDELKKNMISERDRK